MTRILKVFKSGLDRREYKKARRARRERAERAIRDATNS
jgi:hypothetical protein